MRTPWIPARLIFEFVHWYTVQRWYSVLRYAEFDWGLTVSKPSLARYQ